jgi:uncharacterized membrane protein YfcA
MDWTMLPVLLAIGAAIGFLAGLLGVGGGMSLVPLLTILFTAWHFPAPHVVHMAVATATATMVFTATASARAHQRRGAVLWQVVAAMGPGVVVGSLIGPQVASALPTRPFAAMFGAFTWFAASRVVWGKTHVDDRKLPGKAGLFGVGAGIGTIASMVGAGGAFLSVPFLGRHNVKIHNAVGTSAALGLPIAVAATLGFIVAGLREADLPAGSVGYVYVPAMMAIVVASIVAAPVGAAAAHRWPPRKLHRAFAALLVTLGAYLFWKAIRP